MWKLAYIYALTYVVYLPKCRFHRTMTRPFFTRDRISDFDNFDRHAMMVVDSMKSRLQAGFPIDFQVWAAIDLFWKSQFNKCIRMLYRGSLSIRVRFSSIPLNHYLTFAPQLPNFYSVTMYAAFLRRFRILRTSFKAENRAVPTLQRPLPMPSWTRNI